MGSFIFQQNGIESVGNAHIAVLPRAPTLAPTPPRGIPPKLHQSDNSDHTLRQFELVMRLGQSRISIRHVQCAASFVSSAVTGTERGQCISSN
jgi:hypothetical protein